MDVVTKPACLLVVLGMISCWIVSCSRENDVIRHGNLSFDCKKVFDEEPAALALAKAASRGDSRGIEQLISAGAKVNAVGKHDITPLWWAAWAENFDGFSALLKNKADPNVFREEGLPVMHLVAQMNDPRFLNEALKYGGNPDVIDNFTGSTPLFRTVLFDLPKQRDLLINAGADINIQVRDSGRTLLMTAVEANADYKLVYMLLERGANYALATRAGVTLGDVIGSRPIEPNSDRYVWREKVIAFLRGKGMKVEIPSDEAPRK
jgi:ankyrin repeat protein